MRVKAGHHLHVGPHHADALGQIRQRGESISILLELENGRRSAKGLEPYASVEAWRESRDPEDSDSRDLSERDPLLYETGNILADYLSLLAPRSMLVTQP